MQVLELEKQRNLRKEQHKTSAPIHNAPGWNQYLASASEAAIKVRSRRVSYWAPIVIALYQADRSDSTPEELATETVKHIKARHHGATNNHDDRLDALEAGYERDETMGPLSDAAPAAEEDVEEVEITKRTFHKNPGSASG